MWSVVVCIAFKIVCPTIRDVCEKQFSDVHTHFDGKWLNLKKGHHPTHSITVNGVSSFTHTIDTNTILQIKGPVAFQLK